MRFTSAEKQEIIRLVDGSELGVNRILKQLGIHKSTFYNWYDMYQQQGPEDLLSRSTSLRKIWIKIPTAERKKWWK